jgi:hypothetical protein
MKEFLKKPWGQAVLWSIAVILVIGAGVGTGLLVSRPNKPNTSIETPTTAPTTASTTVSTESTTDPTTASTVPESKPATKPTDPLKPTDSSKPTDPTKPTTSTHTHSWKAATCTTPKTCTTCGATEGNPAHSWKSATCTAPKTCTSCGKTEGVKGGHTFVNNTCKTCYMVNGNLEDAYLEIGSPAAYSVGNPAHCAWSLATWNGLIYCGGGDYDKNSGATDIWAYDPVNMKWIKTGTTDDECISKFAVIDGVLTAPGVDPIEGWTYGNYYQLVNGQWEKIRKIPGGIHNFDMVKFDGKLFVGLGVNKGEQPVKYTANGETYTDVPLYKNGSKVKVSSYSAVRAYEFFVKDDQLYAMMGFTKGSEDFYVYHYTGDKMEYVCSANSFIYGSGNGSFNYVSADVTLNGEFYVAANGLFRIKDFSASDGIEKIKLPKEENVRDILVVGDTAYLLCQYFNRIDPKKPVYISIYKTKDMENFELVTDFQFETTALSLEKCGDYLYCSMGTTKENNPKNGTLIRIKLQ